MLFNLMKLNKTSEYFILENLLFVNVEELILTH